jgi:hypothetical protein
VVRRLLDVIETVVTVCNETAVKASSFMYRRRSLEYGEGAPSGALGPLHIDDSVL